MIMTIRNNSSAKRTTVQIPTSSGDAIEAWVYLPEGSGPHPAVVMAHGIGGTVSPRGPVSRAFGGYPSVIGRTNRRG
jgi:dipeptidyl aminopeptidase/acylaminoacyl peptidase